MTKKTPTTEKHHRTDIYTEDFGEPSQESVSFEVVKWAGTDGSSASDIGIFQQTAA
jgi:hypothetical protein